MRKVGVLIEFLFTETESTSFSTLFWKFIGALILIFLMLGMTTVLLSIPILFFWIGNTLSWWLAGIYAILIIAAWMVFESYTSDSPMGP